MAKSKLHSDFLGPFVICNGSINRPIVKETPTKDVAKVQNINYTPTVRVTFEDGSQDVWVSCGNDLAYKEARDTLPNVEFEKFARMAAAFEIVQTGSLAQQNYPSVVALHPGGRVDYLSTAVQEHMDFAKKLAQQVYDRRSAAYAERARATVDAPSVKKSTGVRAKVVRPL